MVSEELDALILLLYQLFPEYEAYDVKIENQLEPPCFIIECYSSSITERITPAGFFFTANFQISFYPGQKDPEKLISEVRFPLMAGLRHFGGESGYKYRGDDIQATEDNGLLHVQFSITKPYKEIKGKIPKIKDIKAEVEVNYVKERN